jgi:hypothetical protein
LSLRAQLSDAVFLGVESYEVEGSEIQLIPSLDRMPILAKHPFFVTRPSENVRVWEVLGYGKAIFSREGTSDLVLSHSIGKSGDSAKVSYHPSFTPSSSPQFFYLGPFSTRPIRFSPDEFLLRSSQRMFATLWVDDHRGERGGGDNVLQKKFSESFDSYWPVKSC